MPCPVEDALPPGPLDTQIHGAADFVAHPGSERAVPAIQQVEPTVGCAAEVPQAVFHLGVDTGPGKCRAGAEPVGHPSIDTTGCTNRPDRRQHLTTGTEPFKEMLALSGASIDGRAAAFQKLVAGGMEEPEAVQVAGPMVGE